MSSTASSAEVGSVGERRGAADQRGQLVHGPGVERDHRDDLLGQHVERVARIAHRLDLAGLHPLGDDGRLDQVAAVLREHHAAADRADLVAGPADPLQPGRDRRRRLDLHDQVDRAHVDAELERGGRDHGRQPAGLQLLLDQGPLLPGHRAVVGAGDHDRRAVAGAGLGGHRGRHPAWLPRPGAQPPGGAVAPVSASPAARAPTPESARRARRTRRGPAPSARTAARRRAR